MTTIHFAIQWPATVPCTRYLSYHVHMTLLADEQEDKNASGRSNSELIYSKAASASVVISAEAVAPAAAAAATTSAAVESEVDVGL